MVLDGIRVLGEGGQRGRGEGDVAGRWSCVKRMGERGEERRGK